MASNTTEVLFRLGIDTKEGQAAFNKFVSDLVTGLKASEKSMESLKSVTATTSRVLDEAKKAGESWTQSQKRQSTERIETINQEAANYKKAVEAIAAAQIERVKGEENASEKIIEIQRATAAEIANSQRRAAEAIKLTQKEFSSTGELGKVFSDLKTSAAEGTLSVNDLTGAVGKLAVQAGPAGVALGAIVGGLGGLKAVADSAAEYGTALETVARAGNLTDKTSAGLLLSIKRTSGSFEDATGLVSQFTTKLNEGREAGSSSEASFKRLGISVDDLRKKSPDEILLKVADGLLKIKDQEARVRGASEIFGDDDANKFLQIAESLRAVSDEAEKLGLVLGPEAKQQIANYRKQLAELDTQVEALKVKAGTPAASLLANSLDFFTQLFGGPEEIKKGGEAVGTQLGTSVQAGLDEKGLTLPTPKPPPKGFALPSRDFSATPGNESLDEKALVEAQAVLAKASAETKAKFEELGQAYNRTAAELIAFEGVTEQNIDGLLKQTRAAQGVQQAVDNTAGSFRELQGAVGEASKAVADAVEVEKAINTEIELNRRELELKNAERRRQGQTEVEIAQATAAAVKESTRQQIDAAEQIYQRKIYLISRAYDVEISKAGGNAEAIKAAKEKFLSEEEKIQNEYDAKALKAAEEREAAKTALEQAAANERSERRQTEFKEFEQDALDQLAVIDNAAKEAGASQETAARRRSEIRQTELQQERQFIQDQLRENNLGAEERKRLSESLAALEIKQRELVRDAESKINDGILADAKRVADERAAAAAKDKAIAAEAIKEVERSNLSEIEKLQQIGALKQQIAELDVQVTEKALAAAQARAAEKGEEVSKNLEVIRLETELIRLRGIAGDVALDTAAKVEEAKNRERVATEGANKALGETPSKAKAAADSVAKNSAALASGIAALINQFRGFIREAQEATDETIDDILKATDERVKGFVNAVIVGPLSGLYLYLKDLASEAQQEAFKTRDRLAEEQRRKEDEERRSQQEADRKELESALAEKAELEQEHADRVHDIQKSIRDEQRRLTSDELKEKEASATRIGEIEEDAKNARIKREQDANARILSDRQKLASDLAEAERQAQNDLLDAQADAIVKRADLEKQLAEQQKSGDTEGAGKTQKALDRLAEDEKTAQARADEEKLARQSATSAEELKILLDGIAEKYRNQKEYLDQVRELEDLGRTDQIAKLKTNFDQQQEIIKQRQADALKALTDRLAAEQEARDKAAAAEDAAFQTRIDKEKSDSQKRLDALKSAANERIDQLQRDLKREENAFAASASVIEARVKELNDKILGLIKPAQDALAGLGNTAGASTGGQSAGGSPASGPANQGPPSTPPPATTPPPGTGSQPSTGGTGKAEKEENREQLKRSFDVLLNNATQFATDAAKDKRISDAVGFITSAKESLEKNWLRDSRAYVVKLATEYVEKLKAFEAKLIADFGQPTGPAKSGGTTPDGPGQTQGGTASTVGSTPTGPKLKDPTVAGAAGGQKQAARELKRDAAYAQSLVDRADVAKTPEEAKKIFDEAQAARGTKIDEDDFNRIKARLDNSAFKGGFIQQFSTVAAEKASGPGPKATNGPSATFTGGSTPGASTASPIATAQGASRAAPVTAVGPGAKAGISVSVNVGDVSVNDSKSIIPAVVDALTSDLRKQGVPV